MKTNNKVNRWLISLTAVFGATTITFASLYIYKVLNDNSHPAREEVKVTFNSQIGEFNDKNIIKTITVKPGTKLNECYIDKPIFRFSYHGIDETKEISCWSNDSNEEALPENYVITNDINLTAHYYPLLDIQSICIGNGLNMYYKTIGQRYEDDFRDFIIDYIDIIMKSKDKSRIIAYGDIALSISRPYVLKGQGVLDYSNLLIANLGFYQGQKAQAIGKISSLMIEKYDKDIPPQFNNFCFDKLFGFIKKIKLEYVPWASMICSDKDVFDTLFKAFKDESDDVHQVFSNDFSYFSESIIRSSNSAIANNIALIGIDFFNSVSGHTSELEFVNEKFEEARALVEELL